MEYTLEAASDKSVNFAWSKNINDEAEQRKLLSKLLTSVDFNKTVFSYTLALILSE